MAVVYQVTTSLFLHRTTAAIYTVSLARILTLLEEIRIIERFMNL